MAEPNRPLGRRARVDDPLVQRIIFEAVWRFVWRALARYHLAHADRKDVAQDVVIAAWRGRAGYREDRGNPEQWLSRIVRNAAADFLSRRGKEPQVVAVASVPDTPSDDPPLEERMCLRDIADLVFAVLPEGERRAVIAVAIEGRSLREIAAQEGVSASTVHERYERGIAALRAAVERGEEKGLFAIPFAVDRSTPEGGSEPPPEVLEEAWQRAVVELGLDRAPDSEPPSSGSRRCESSGADEDPEPPSRRRPRGWPANLLRLLGPLGGALIGGVLAVNVMHGCKPDPPRAESRQPMVLAAAPVPIDAPLATNDAAPSPASSTTATSAEVAPSASAERPAPRAYRDAFDLERILMDRGRAALRSKNIAGALTALEEHARRFPNGQNAATRARLWELACASDAAKADARCGRRPQ